MPSARLFLGLASVVFILTVVGIAIGFSLLARTAVENAGREMGTGELHAAVELLESRIHNIEHRVTGIRTEVEISPLWSKNDSYYNSSSSKGVMNFVNDTQFSLWAGDLWASSAWSLGYGLLTFFDYTSTSSNNQNSIGAISEFQFPQMYFDVLEDGSKEYVWGQVGGNTSNPSSGANETQVWYNNFMLTQNSTSDRTDRKVLSLGKAYGNSNPNATWQRSRLVGAWEDSVLWAAKGNEYHYMSYVTRPLFLEASNNVTTMGAIGWLATTDILNDLQLVAGGGLRGTILMVDAKERIITTTNLDYNAALAAQIKTPGKDGRVNDVYPEELGINFPDAEVRAVYATMKDGLASLAENEKREVTIDVSGRGVYFVTEQVVLSLPAQNIHISLIWYAKRSDLIGSLERDQLLIGASILLFSIIVSCLLLGVAYSSVVNPLAHLTKSMEALANIDMDLVDSLQKIDEKGSFSVSEVNSLYQSYNSVKTTMKQCLPYIPQLEGGDIRVGAAGIVEILEYEDMQDANSSSVALSSLALSSATSSIHLDNPLGGSVVNARRSVDNASHFVSTGDSDSSTGSKEKPVGLFAVMSESLNNSVTTSRHGPSSHGPSSRTSTTLLTSSTSSSYTSSAPIPFVKVTQDSESNHSQDTIKPLGITRRKDSQPRSQPTAHPIAAGSGSFSSKASPPRSVKASGLNRGGSTLLSSRGSVNKELALKDGAVVAHFRLRPDIKWHPGDEGAGFRDLSFLLQYTVTKVASEYKGNVFHLGTNSIACVWTGVVQAEKKAVEASTKALELILEKALPMLGGNDLTVPVATVGIVRGSVLLGTSGTLLKRTYVCEGPAVHISSILSHIGHQVRAHILTDPAVQQGSSMFAELRPVEEVKIPDFWSSFTNYDSKVMTLWECIGFKGSANISANLAGAKQKMDGGNNSPSNNSFNEDLEWMYQLEANQRAEAKRLSFAVNAHQALKVADLALYRAALREWVSHGFMENDLFLMHRMHVFGIADDLAERSVGSGSSRSQGDNTPTMDGPFEGAVVQIAKFFDDLKERQQAGQPIYYREATVEGGSRLPFEIS